MRQRMPFPAALAGVVLSSAFALAPAVRADGVVRPPRDYEGSLEETAQEAILILYETDSGTMMEDLILKIRVEGDAERFGWVVPLPNPPETGKEDAKLFQELFDYVEARRPRKTKGLASERGSEADSAGRGVEVISRKIVGSFDVAVVRETEPGRLNAWLEDQGFRTLPDAEDVLGFYRGMGYVYACIKVSEAALDGEEPVDVHPLRFTFETGGKDGAYYPMKMTGLQNEPFDVNLYVFYRAWLNDDLNRFGFEHRGFGLAYRDWDTRECLPNGGKTWSSPETDPFLKPLARLLPAVKALMRRLHPGDRFYLTNLKAVQLEPAQVRRWKGDLWLFPHYVDEEAVPLDARPGGPAHAIYPPAPSPAGRSGGAGGAGGGGSGRLTGMLLVLVAVVALLAAFLVFVRARERAA